MAVAGRGDLLGSQRRLHAAGVSDLSSMMVTSCKPTSQKRDVGHPVFGTSDRCGPPAEPFEDPYMPVTNSAVIGTTVSPFPRDIFDGQTVTYSWRAISVTNPETHQ